MRFKLTRLAICIGMALFAMPPLLAETPVERHQVKDGSGRQITYYLGHPKTPAPLLVMIQGSGCELVMNSGSSGAYSTLYDFLPFAAEGKFAVLAVEKPYAGIAVSQMHYNATDCSAQFNADFTAESWLRALEAGVDDALRHPWVARGPILVLGTSEGAVMAALLAGHDKRITDAIIVSGTGTSQLFDFIAFAYQRCFDRAACIADVEKQARAINAAPQSSTDFAWGHPYKRWSSFFRVDPGEELLRSKARVYLAFGTADNNVPTLSEEIIAAKLLGAGRDVTVRRVPDGDHSLAQPGAPGWQNLDREYRAALAWYWQAHPQ